MKKGEAHLPGMHDNSFGVASAVLGIFALLASVSIPLQGLIAAVVALVFSKKQQNKFPNSWGRTGFIISIIGIILNFIFLLVAIYALKNLQQFQGLGSY